MASGKIYISNNQNNSGFARCCFCYFKEVDDKVLFRLESYGQKEIDVLFDEAFAILDSGIED